MHSWGTIQLSGALPSEQRALEALVAKHQPTYAKYKAYRSEVIEAALFVESRLEVLLCHLYIGPDPERVAMFRSTILDPESGSFGKKWHMLREAFALHGMPRDVLSDAERKQLLTSLQRLMNDRNKFAHGDLYVDVQSGQILLRYFEGGQKQMYLDERHIEEILGNAESAHALLERVISVVQ